MVRHGSFSVVAFDPDTLSILGSAFDSAMQSLGPLDAEHLDPHSARQSVAKYIIESASSGERDLVRLRDSALARLRGRLN
jgi:hypothetical protein